MQVLTTARTPPFSPQVRGPLLLEIPVPRRDRYQSAETGGAAGAAGVVVGAVGVDAGAAMDSGATAAGSGGVAVSISGSAPAGLMGTEARLPNMATVVRLPNMATEARLLAVDLGLRMGLALFNGEGRLLQYAYRRVEIPVHASAHHGAHPPFSPQVRGPLLLEIPVPRRDRYQSAETGGAAGAAGVVVGAVGVDAGAAMDSGATAAGSGGVAVSISGSAPAGLMGTEARLPNMATVVRLPNMATEARLLAVDLGLRMGLALFNGEGRLLQYAYRRVEIPVHASAHHGAHPPFSPQVRVSTG